MTSKNCLPHTVSNRIREMLPFLFIATRPETAAADEEYELFQRRLGVPADKLIRIRLDQRSLPEDLDLAAYSGIVLAGGPLNSSTPSADKSETQVRIEAELRNLVLRVIETDFPFFGACYGIGTVGSALGATIDRTAGETASAPAIKLTEAGRDDPILQGIPDQFHAMVAHTEGCVDTPRGATLLATSPTCKVQMFRVGNNIYATQFHPEADGRDFLRRMSFYKDFGYFEPAQYDSIQSHFLSLDLTGPLGMLGNFKRHYATQKPHTLLSGSCATVVQ